MDTDSVDPVIASAVTEIVNRFGAPGLDQLERATELARPGAQRAGSAPVEQSHIPLPQPSGTTPPADDGEVIHDQLARDNERSTVRPETTAEMTRLLTEWRAASEAVRTECENYWIEWTDHVNALDRQAPTEEDRRRLYAFYSVEQAARDQFFLLIDAAP